MVSNSKKSSSSKSSKEKSTKTPSTTTPASKTGSGKTKTKHRPRKLVWTAPGEGSVTGANNKRKKQTKLKPMTLEEINELKNNIDSLLDEDFDDVIYRVAQYTEDIRGGVIPVETLPVHFQWELHDFVAGKLRRQIRFLHTPSPEPTTEPVMNIQSISVPCLGENSADKGLINGEGLLDCNDSTSAGSNVENEKNNEEEEDEYDDILDVY